MKLARRRFPHNHAGKQSPFLTLVRGILIGKAIQWSLPP